MLAAREVSRCLAGLLVVACEDSKLSIEIPPNYVVFCWCVLIYGNSHYSPVVFPYCWAINSATNWTILWAAFPPFSLALHNFQWPLCDMKKLYLGLCCFGNKRGVSRGCGAWEHTHNCQVRCARGPQWPGPLLGLEWPVRLEGRQRKKPCGIHVPNPSDRGLDVFTSRSQS